jgi:hypothetical protein
VYRADTSRASPEHQSQPLEGGLLARPRGRRTFDCGRSCQQSVDGELVIYVMRFLYPVTISMLVPTIGQRSFRRLPARTSPRAVCTVSVAASGYVTGPPERVGPRPSPRRS